MIVVLVLAIAVVAGVLTYLLVTDLEWLRSQAECEVRIYAARRARDLDELKRAMRRDSERVRREFDVELRELDE